MALFLHTQELTCANAMPLIFAPPSFCFCTVVFHNGVKQKLTEARKNEGLFLHAGAHSCKNSNTIFRASVNFFLHLGVSQQCTKTDGGTLQKPYPHVLHFRLCSLVKQLTEAQTTRALSAQTRGKNRAINFCAPFNFFYTVALHFATV